MTMAGEEVSELIATARTFLGEGRLREALDVLVSARAYVESGILMSPLDAREYLASRFPQGKLSEALEAERRGEIKEAIEILLGMFEGE